MKENTRKLIAVKKIAAEKQLPFSKIVDIVEKHGGNVSERTLQRVFANGSEKRNFRYSTIDDLYNAFTAEFSDAKSADIFNAFHAILLEYKESYERTIALAEERIAKQDEIIDRLTARG